MNPNIQRLREERDAIRLEEIKAEQEKERARVLAVEKEKESEAEGAIVGRTWGESASYRELQRGVLCRSVGDESFWTGPWKELLADVFEKDPELMSVDSESPATGNKFTNRRTLAWRMGFRSGVEEIYAQVEGDGSNS